jgi:hypothetical protein
MSNPIVDMSCRVTPFWFSTTSVHQSLNGQAKENWYHTNGLMIERSCRKSSRINDTFRESHNHWSQICRCDFIRSISPASFYRSVSSARSRSLHIIRRISSPDRSLPSIHLLSRLIYSPVHLRSTLGVGASPRRVHLIYTTLSPDLRTASTTSRRSFCVIAVLCLRGYLRRRLPRSPWCCSLHSPGETGFRCRNRPRICDMNAYL